VHTLYVNPALMNFDRDAGLGAYYDTRADGSVDGLTFATTGGGVEASRDSETRDVTAGACLAGVVAGTGAGAGVLGSGRGDVVTIVGVEAWAIGATTVSATTGASGAGAVGAGTAAGAAVAGGAGVGPGERVHIHVPRASMARVARAIPI
jgi:hypothetical protein